MAEKNSGKVIGIVLVFVVIVGGMYLFSSGGTSTAIDNTVPPTPGTSNGYSITTSTPSTTETAAPNFSLRLLDGQKIELASYKGEQAVILDFWTSWCPNCKRSFPKTVQMYNKYNDRIEIIGINMNESKVVAQKFVDQTVANFPIGIDRGAIVSQYGVRYTNTHVLINKEGNIVNMIAGDLNESHITSLLN